VIPVDIVLQENIERYHVRVGENAKIGNEIPIGTDKKAAIEEIRNEVTNMWQTRWISSSKGRSTFAFFRGVRNILTVHSIKFNLFAAAKFNVERA